MPDLENGKATESFDTCRPLPHGFKRMRLPLLCGVIERKPHNGKAVRSSSRADENRAMLKSLIVGQGFGGDYVENLHARLHKLADFKPG